MKSLKILLLTILVGIGVAITYFYFEAAIHHSVNYVWDDLFDTENQRLMVVPICLSITLAYFAVQHLLDKRSEDHESQGLGSAPEPTVANFVKILLIGFLSLLAGASLGPEAILVPSCVLLGSFVGLKLLSEDKKGAKLLGMAGFIALFAAFFNSFFVGLLSLLLIKRQFKLNLNTKLVIFAAVASASTVATLNLLDSSAYIRTPDYSWSINFASLAMIAALALAGYFTTYILKFAHTAGEIIIKPVKQQAWWLHAIVAGAGLSLLYLFGGSLVQFTGNESVTPLLEQSAELGLVGLAWIFIVKIAAISWSKASGYRGGLVFPSAFAASVLVATAQLYVSDLNFIYGLIAAMAGIIAADSKVKFLF
jgi:H+/Cl- antiporter ClcA